MVLVHEQHPLEETMASSGARWPQDFSAGDRGHVKDVARMLLDHLQNGSAGVQRALHIDIDHPVPFVDLE